MTVSRTVTLKLHGEELLHSGGLSKTILLKGIGVFDACAAGQLKLFFQFKYLFYLYRAKERLQDPSQ